MPDYTTLALILVSFAGAFISIPIGGSFLFIIPAFLLLGLNGLEAILLGRILIIASTGGASSYFIKHHNFDWKQNSIFVSGSFIGYLAAAKLVTSADIETVTKIVPWILLAGGFFMIKDIKLKHPKHQKYIENLFPLLGILIGFYGGLGGAGGGKIIVMLLVLAIGWELKRSIINTRLIEFASNIFAVGAYLYFGAQLTGYEIPVILSAIAGGLIGAKFTLKSKPEWLKYSFLVLVLISAIKVTFF